MVEQGRFEIEVSQKLTSISKAGFISLNIGRLTALVVETRPGELKAGTCKKQAAKRIDRFDACRYRLVSSYVI